MIGGEYNLVVPKLSKAKRNFIILGGFFAGCGLIVLVYFLTDIIIPILWYAIVYALVLMALSGRLLQLKKIGMVYFGETEVSLQNPELGMERTIELANLKSAFVRRGLATNMVFGIKRKTLIVDMLTNENEPVSMQIEVKESDIKTTDHLGKYFEENNIGFNRKI